LTSTLAAFAVGSTVPESVLGPRFIVALCLIPDTAATGPGT